MGRRKDYPVGSVALLSFACGLAALAACTTVTRGTARDDDAAQATSPAPPAQVEWNDRISPPPLGLSSDPKRFIGAKPDFLLAELGKPFALRKEAPAQVWQYRAEECVIDIFLYEQADGPAVVYLEARDLKAAPAETGVCLGNLLNIAHLSKN